jgi:hypothetical protein
MLDELSNTAVGTALLLPGRRRYGQALLYRLQKHLLCWKYGRTPFIRINWDGAPSGYAENPDNWIFL